MSIVIDLASRRHTPTFLKWLSHPAGVSLPFDGPSDAALIIPEIRSEIRSGAYSADIIQFLPDVVRAGDRVLVIGAGLGVVSTLVAKTEGVARIIAVEANTAVVPYLNRVHALNGVPWVETINAVMGDSGKGRTPFFCRRDIRTSSLLPHNGSWQQVMMVPLMDLDLILAEEQISLIVCGAPAASAQLLECAELGSVEQILVGSGGGPGECWDENEICSLLAAQGFVAKSAEPLCCLITPMPALSLSDETGPNVELESRQRRSDLNRALPWTHSCSPARFSLRERGRFVGRNTSDETLIRSSTVVLVQSVSLGRRRGAHCPPPCFGLTLHSRPSVLRPASGAAAGRSRPSTPPAR